MSDEPFDDKIERLQGQLGRMAPTPRNLNEAIRAVTKVIGVVSLGFKKLSAATLRNTTEIEELRKQLEEIKMELRR